MQTMNLSARQQVISSVPRLPFDCVALVLQGGGALGAYQGGVYEALAEAAIHPSWIAGISIGAIREHHENHKPPTVSI
jgi:NTE family protein